MNVYFMRHGMTDWNLYRKIQGQTDIPLNQIGQKQADNARIVLKDYNFDKCFCSPLGRAHETARRVLQDKNIDIVTNDLIKEISYGVDEGQDLDLIEKDSSVPLHNYFFAPDLYIPPQNGETIPEVVSRCAKFLNFLQVNCTANSNILAVCHGAFIQGVIMAVKKTPYADFWKVKAQKNCAITSFTFKDGKWQMLQEAVDILGTEKLSMF